MAKFEYDGDPDFEFIYFWVCEKCGGRIDGARQGIALFLDDSGNSFETYHKGECDPKTNEYGHEGLEYVTRELLRTLTA